MDQETQTPAPEPRTGITLYRFCAKHKLCLTLGQRMAAGLELTQLVKERRLPLIKVRERVKANQWGLTRLYPESLLNEWLVRYTEAQAKADAAVTESVSEPQPTSANG